MSSKLVDLLHKDIEHETKVVAAYRLLDWLGCAAVGALEPPGILMGKYAQSLEHGSSFCFGDGKKDAQAAAFVNGALGNILEMDDLHRMAIVHPGDTVIPAALAVAQRENSSAEEILNAIVRGYEAVIRVGQAAGASHYQYWYSTSTCGVFGAAVAATSLIDGSTEKLLNAIGLAGMQASGLWQCRLENGYGKQLATARAAQSGVIAADLANLDFPAPKRIIEGELGFLEATADGYSLEALEIDSKEPWKIHEVSEKPWPGCRHSHPVIEAALFFKEFLAEEEIKSVEVHTYKSAIEFCDDRQPETPHRARFSLQHAFAVAFVKGEPELADYISESLTNDNLVRIRERVELYESDHFTRLFPGNFGCKVIVHTKAGHILEKDIVSAKGDPENPIDVDARSAKFNKLMSYAKIPSELILSLEQAVVLTPFEDSAERMFGLLDRVSKIIADTSDR